MIPAVFWSALFLFFSSWLFYPALLLVLSALRRKHDDRWEEPEVWPSVSVLIAARNEEPVIGDRIRNLLEQDYAGPLEILVGSDSSSDGTDRVVESFSEENVILHRSRERVGKPLMIQELLDLSSGEILVFTDADTVFAPDTVSHLVIPYSGEDIGCVDGSRRNSLTGETCESVYWKYEKSIKKLCSSMGAVLGATGAVFSIRRDLFRPLSRRRADDFELAVMTRLQGYDCVFNEKAVAMEPSPDDRKQYRRMVRIVSWMFVSCILLMGKALAGRKLLLLLQLLFHKMLRWMSGILLVAATIGAGLMLENSFFLVIFVMLCLFHLLAVLGRLHRSILPSKMLFPYYFWLMNMAAIDGILRTLSGKPVETWEKKKGESS